MSRRNTRRNNQSNSKPGWVWFVLGNFVGGFGVFIWMLSDLKTEQIRGAIKVGKPKAESAAEAPSKPHFDFYTLLEENEVKVSKPVAQQRRGSGENAAAAQQNPDTRESVPSNLVYILQAASFRDATEAERLRAQLTLSNLDVKVETASDSRGTWHRVLVGPYTNRSMVAKARGILAEHRLMPLVLKRPAKT